jgi:hypothetical protein
VALVIGVRKGHKVYLDDVPLTVYDLRDYNYAKVEVDGKFFVLSDQETVEVYPTVWVSCGAPSPERLKKREEFTRYMEMEERKRLLSLKQGGLTQAEFDALPELEEPYDIMRRLIFEAPRTVTILREELYASRVG